MQEINDAAKELPPTQIDWLIVKQTLSMAAALPRFFRERITLERAEEDIMKLLGTRPRRFLELARSLIYQRPRSPYLRLLKHAGCEFSDLEREVARHGLEEALLKLAAAGVYVTSDEFKGKTEIVRGGLAFASHQRISCTGIHGRATRWKAAVPAISRSKPSAHSDHARSSLEPWPSSMQPMTCSPVPTLFTSRS